MPDESVPTEPPPDFIVLVDRSIKPTYPVWVKKVLHPELELAGPTEYNLETQVDQWLHKDQKIMLVPAETVYKDLKEAGILATFLNLQDGLAIREKGVIVFRKLFAGKAVFLWGSTMQDHNGGLMVPCLYDFGVEIGLNCFWLGDHCDSDNPALRFKPKK